MSLTSRKRRPITRDEGAYRDDRLFIVACDDTYAPKQYFAFFRLPRIQVHVVPTENGTSAAEHVLDRLLSFEHEPDDERWMVLDTDHYASNTHIPTLKSAIRRARHNGVHVALSKPSFDFWLLLHHLDDVSVLASLDSASAVERKLREILGRYNKLRLRGEDFPVSAVTRACKTAEHQDVGGSLLDTNGSRVYKLWRSMAAETLPQQLPKEFAELIRWGRRGRRG